MQLAISFSVHASLTMVVSYLLGIWPILWIPMKKRGLRYDLNDSVTKLLQCNCHLLKSLLNAN